MKFLYFPRFLLSWRHSFYIHHWKSAFLISAGAPSFLFPSFSCFNKLCSSYDFEQSTQRHYPKSRNCVPLVHKTKLDASKSGSLGSTILFVRRLRCLSFDKYPKNVSKIASFLSRCLFSFYF